WLSGTDRSGNQQYRQSQTGVGSVARTGQPTPVDDRQCLGGVFTAGRSVRHYRGHRGGDSAGQSAVLGVGDSHSSSLPVLVDRTACWCAVGGCSGGVQLSLRREYPACRGIARSQLDYFESSRYTKRVRPTSPGFFVVFFP